jgi:hypothetical protein
VKIKETSKKWKDILLSSWKESVFLKFPHYQKQFTDSMYPYQNTNGILTELEKTS